MDRPARVPLRVVLRLPHNLRVARIIPTVLITRTRRDMLRVAMDPIMDPDMALISAITVLVVRDIVSKLLKRLRHIVLYATHVIQN